MHKELWQWSLEIKALFQKQSISSCQDSKQKQGFFSFLKRQAQKISDVNLLLTPYNQSTLM